MENQVKIEKLLIESLVKESKERGKIDKEVELESIEKLTGDASSRRYFRLKTNKDNYVVCLQQPLDKEKDTFIKMQEVFLNSSVAVPKLFDFQIKKGFILEQDLGDRTLLKHLSSLQNREEEKKAYVKALEELIKIHSIEKSNFSGAPFSSLFFDEEKLFKEVLFTKSYLINGLFNQSLSEQQEKVLESSFIKICQLIASKKMVVCHRDYHSRNIMVVNGEVVVIDFQDARMGLPQYDLVSLLEDCYYKVSRENKHDLKMIYWDNFLQKNCPQESKEEYLRLYDLMTIQRTFKALGSFAYIYKNRNDIRYLKYIGYAFENLRDVLFRYDDFRDLRVCLSEIYYEY